MPLSLDSGVTFSSFDCLVPSSLEEGGGGGVGGCTGGDTTGWVEAEDRNWKDMEEFIPLAVNSGTVEMLLLPRDPPVRLGSADCRADT